MRILMKKKGTGVLPLSNHKIAAPQFTNENDVVRLVQSQNDKYIDPITFTNENDVVRLVQSQNDKYIDPITFDAV